MENSEKPKPLNKLRLDAGLYHAVLNDQRDILRHLLVSGADVDKFYADTTGISAQSVLHIACEKGRFECVKILLEHDALTDVRDKWGQTPLMYSVLTQFTEITDLLLSWHPQYRNSKDHAGRSALHRAVELCSVDCTRILLTHGADVNCKTMEGITPLMTLCALPESDITLTILEMLLEVRAELELKEYRMKQTALQFAAMSRNNKTTCALLQAGADPDSLDIKGRTPLVNSIMKYSPTGNHRETSTVEIVRLLVDGGSFIGQSGYLALDVQCVPLFAATLSRESAIVQCLLEQGASPNVQAYHPSKFHHTTPLHIAAENGHLEICKHLLNWGADMYSTVHLHVCHPFQLALQKHHEEVVNVLIKAGYRLTPLFRDYLVEVEVMYQKPELLTPEILCLMEWLMDIASNPPSLKHLSTVCIRNALSADIDRKLEFLCLPKSVTLEMRL